MGALTALQRSPGALLRNPVLVIPVLVIGLFQLPQLLLPAVDPLLSSLVSLAISGLFVFVVPFFQGGIIGMADESIDGRTRLGTFVAEGRTNYVNILVVYLLLVAINLVASVVLLVAAFVLGLLVLQGAQFPGFAIGFVGLFLVLFALAFALVVFFVQFYGQAIVLDGAGAVESIKRSFGLVRRNLLSTLGYSIAGGVIGGISGLGLVALSALVSPRPPQIVDLPELSVPTLVVAALAAVVLVSVVGSFLSIFSVAFYREMRP